MTTFLTEWANQTWSLLTAAAPWLLVGFGLAGVVYVLVPVAKVTHHLGRGGLSAVLKASLLGIPLPLCSCSVIPVATSIRKQGASRGAFVSFLISTPETGVDSIAISFALLGPFLAIARPVAAFATAVTAGLLVGGSKAETTPASDSGNNPVTNDHCSGPSACTDSPNSLLGARGIGSALRYGFVEMVTDLSPWLVAGFLAAGAVAALMPEGFLEENIGTGLPAMLLMLAVGLPMYVCSTSSTPIAAALMAGGLSPGAALVFLLAGPATNLATMVVVSRDLGRRGLVLYLTTIAVVAVLFGLAVDQLLPSLPISLARIPTCSTETASLTVRLMAVAFILLTLNGLRIRVRAALRR